MRCSFLAQAAGRHAVVAACFLASVLALAPSAARASAAVEAYLAGDYERARIEWSSMAEQGDAVARYNLAMLYLQGLGVPRQPERAAELMSPAAAAGYGPARYQLAMLSPSPGSNADRSRFWLDLAARQGHAMAAFELGRLLAGENGGGTDSRSALEWLHKARAAGIAEAQASLDTLEATLPGGDGGDEVVETQLTEGRGTLAQRHEFFEGQKAFINQDYARAVEIWAPLAEAGVARAQYGIAFMLESGWGVVQDYAEAAYWYTLAARKGHAKAQFNLGRMYVDGRGTDRDRGIGLYWIQSAADRGEPRALQYMANLD